jgi:hypothetical protein
MSLPRPGPASRLFCIGRNYAGHAREMNAECPVEPVVFLKPGSCLRRMGQPLELPAGEGEVHYEGELVLLLSGEARAPFAAAALGLDLTLRAILRAGAYEILERPDIPPRVTINEYVDVAHAFFGDGEEPGMINAVLDRLARQARSTDLAEPAGG